MLSWIDQVDSMDLTSVEVVQCLEVLVGVEPGFPAPPPVCWGGVPLGIEPAPDPPPGLPPLGGGGGGGGNAPPDPVPPP